VRTEREAHLPQQHLKQQPARHFGKAEQVVEQVQSPVQGVQEAAAEGVLLALAAAPEGPAHQLPPVQQASVDVGVPPVPIMVQQVAMWPSPTR